MRKAYRIADNQTATRADWNRDRLERFRISIHLRPSPRRHAVFRQQVSQFLLDLGIVSAYRP